MHLTPGGPATRAGLQIHARNRDDNIVPGDVITAINTEPVPSLGDMLALRKKNHPGENLALALWRNASKRRQASQLDSGE